MTAYAHAQGSSFENLAEHVWSILREYERRNFFQSHAPHAWRPRVNVYETRDSLYVCVALAGLSKEEIDVHVEDGVLSIGGVRSKPEIPLPPGSPDAASEIRVHVMEIDSGRFVRRIPIPRDVDIECVHAKYRNGYLWVMLPRQCDENQETEHDD